MFKFPFFGGSTPPTPEAGPAGGQPAPSADITGILAAAYQARDAANTELTTLRATMIAAEDQFKQLQASHTDLNTKLQAAITENTGLKQKVTDIEAAAAKTREEIRADVVNKELATLAAGQGITLNEVPKPNGAPEANESLAARIQAEADPFSRAALRMSAFAPKAAA